MYTIPCYQRRSILVRTAVLEEGPKNPLKGTTVKPLVLASYAQFGVGAGGRHELVMPADPGRFPMAWKIRPYFCGDLLLWGNVLPCGKRLRHEADLNLQCGVIRPLRRKCCVQSSLPCVGMGVGVSIAFRPKVMSTVPRNHICKRG